MIKHMRPDEASRLFRAAKGDKWAQSRTTVEEIATIIPAETFKDFLDKNQISIFERVIR